MVGVEHFLGDFDVANFFGALFPRHREQPVEIVAGDRRFGRHGRHGLELLQFLDGFLVGFAGHPGGVDLLLQLVELAFFPAAELLLNGLDLFVEVVLFLSTLHLALHARLDGAIHVELFNLDVEHVADAGEALRGIKDFQQLLFFFDGQLQIRGDSVGQLRRIVVANGGDHRLVVERLAELYILLEQSGDALHRGFDLRRQFGAVFRGANRRFKVAVGVDDLQDLAALEALDQDLDIAVGQFETLDDIDDGADLVDLVGLGLVDTGVVLGCEKNLLVASQRVLEGTHAGLPSDHEGRHHEREDHDVPDRHHGEFFSLELFSLGHWNRLVFRASPL